MSHCFTLFAAPCDGRFWHTGQSRGLPHRDAFCKHHGQDFFLPFRCEPLKCGRTVAPGDAFHDRLCLLIDMGQGTVLCPTIPWTFLVHGMLTIGVQLRRDQMRQKLRSFVFAPFVPITPLVVPDYCIPVRIDLYTLVRF